MSMALRTLRRSHPEHQNPAAGLDRRPRRPRAWTLLEGGETGGAAPRLLRVQTPQLWRILPGLILLASTVAACAKPASELVNVGHTPAATQAPEPDAGETQAPEKRSGAAQMDAQRELNASVADARPGAPTATLPDANVHWALTQTQHKRIDFPRERLVWQLINRVNWQPRFPDLASDIPDGAQVAEPTHEGSTRCPGDMALVSGNFLLDSAGREDSDEVLLAQNEACGEWRLGQKGMFGICERFDDIKWTNAITKFKRKPLAVCVDRYEFPNRFGEFPLVVTTFAESQAYCAQSGKRLCSESEWTFTCEGELALPYPYGYARDSSACQIDVSSPGINEDTFNPRTTGRTADGLSQAWRALPSGRKPRCVSPFGVYDMTGNVDEWTTTVRTWGYPSILKGGYWGKVRTRCRPQTRAHGPMFVTYEQGFRCCKAATSGVP
jgi:formylglycine-generating enzyme